MLSLIIGLGTYSDASLPQNHLKAGPDLPATALDRYIADVDSSFRWQKVESKNIQGIHVQTIKLVSQTWQPPAPVDKPQWQHRLVVYTPPALSSKTALLYISGGKTDETHKKLPNATLAGIAKRSGAVTAELRAIPNQYLVFAEDGQMRKEDDLVAYTWARFLASGNSRWPVQLPMVKSVVRAMDVLQSMEQIDSFILAGASKRGWTTWLGGAVDSRVKAMIPLVIDVLNMAPSMEHHKAAYGYWSPAIADYVRHGIMEQRHHPNFGKLVALVDPYAYRKRLNLPKYMINAAGDEFFLPDSSQFYFDKLPGEKYLRYIPNTKHNLKHTDAFESLEAFFSAVIRNQARPRFQWQINASEIRVVAQDPPAEVKLWQATNPGARDFRLDSIGSVWTAKNLIPDGDGKTYVASLTPPPDGWTAFFVELIYSPPTSIPKENPVPPLKFTTPVKVLPERLPFATPKKD